MPEKVRKIKKALKSKGFMEDNRTHIAYFFVYKGRKTSVKTVISHGEYEYSDSLLSLMKKELKLSKEEFLGVIGCSLKEKDLIGIYIHKGTIEL